jgi:hypothetical protein
VIVGDDGVLTAKLEGAMPLHIDGIPYFAFTGYVDCLYSTDKPVARWMIDPVTDSEFCFHLKTSGPKLKRVVRSQYDGFAIGVPTQRAQDRDTRTRYDGHKP